MNNIFISLKTLVGFSNILVYLILVLLFLSFGYTNFGLTHKGATAAGYALLGIATLIFIIYQILRYYELKSTTFQLSHKHIIWNRVFYINQYLIIGLALLNVILLSQNILTGLPSRIYFFVLFPYIFLSTTVCSILESIIRVEERIFLNKETWKKSAEWEKLQTKLTKTSKSSVKNQGITYNLNDNPFQQPLLDNKFNSKNTKDKPKNESK